MKYLKNKYIQLFLVLLIGIFIGIFSKPDSEKVVYKEKIVEVEKKQTTETKKTEEIKKTKEIIKPDGTKIYITEHKNKETDKKEEKKENIKQKDLDISKEVVYSTSKEWILSLSILPQNQFDYNNPIYNLNLNKKIIGPVYGGIILTSEGKLGPTITVIF